MLCQQLPFDDEELEDTGERLLAIRRSQESPDRTPFYNQLWLSKYMFLNNYDDVLYGLKLVS